MMNLSYSTTGSTGFPKFSFPFKLHDILEDAAREGHDCIVSWLPHGRAFKIYSKPLFETVVMSRHFPTSLESRPPKYRSFTRQLAIYGFKMNTDRKSPERGSYSHPLMVRGKPELCLGMSRQKIKGGTLFNKRGSAAGGSNNRPLQPEVENPTPVEILSEFFLGQEPNPTCESMLNEQADSEEPDFDHHQKPVLASTQSRLGDDGFNEDEDDDLLAFAILANDYIAQTMKSSSSVDGGKNPLAAALVPDASSSGRRWLLLQHDGFHGVLQQQEQAEILNAIEKLVIRQGRHCHDVFDL